MKVIVKSGDVLDEKVDVLICTANPLLRMSGGVNGMLLQRDGRTVQEELNRYLGDRKLNHVPRGTIVPTGPGPLAVSHILHAVGVDVFYATTIPIVEDLIRLALGECLRLKARTVAMPALATGYGPLTIAEFGAALGQAVTAPFEGIDELRVVLRTEEEAEEVRRAL